MEKMDDLNFKKNKDENIKQENIKLKQEIKNLNMMLESTQNEKDNIMNQLIKCILSKK